MVPEPEAAAVPVQAPRSTCGRRRPAADALVPAVSDSYRRRHRMAPRRAGSGCRTGYFGSLSVRPQVLSYTSTIFGYVGMTRSRLIPTILPAIFKKKVQARAPTFVR
jgi:hypothetical protein